MISFFHILSPSSSPTKIFSLHLLLPILWFVPQQFSHFPHTLNQPVVSSTWLLFVSPKPYIANHSLFFQNGSEQRSILPKVSPVANKPLYTYLHTTQFNTALDEKKKNPQIFRYRIVIYIALRNMNNAIASSRQKKNSVKSNI